MHPITVGSIVIYLSFMMLITGRNNEKFTVLQVIKVSG
jgi:hypothetical protein